MSRPKTATMGNGKPIHNGKATDPPAKPAVMFAVSVVGEGRDAKVTLTEQGPTSAHVTQWDAEQADNIARLIQKGADRARLGLILPPSEGAIE